MSLPYEIRGPKDIRVDRLLFWPNNPRLKISDFEEVRLPNDQLIDVENQKKIYRLLAQHELHDVDKLAASMRQSGFMREKALIALEVGDTNKYLVLEGNRRLAAIRTVLRENDGTLSKFVLASLTKIPCFLFVHTSKDVPEEVAISRMVAEAHIKGQKPHTKIQQAHMLYNAYMGFLVEKGVSEFVKNAEVMNSMAEFFEIPKKELEQELAVFRVYKQLTDAGYEVPHRLRERLTWIYQNPGHFRANFGYSADHFELDEEGLERFYDLFVDEDCAVKNPPAFKRLLNVMRYGTSQHIELIRVEPAQLENIERQILDERDDQKFENQLKRIHQSLSGLKLHQFRGSREEKALIEEISDLVDTKLGKLAQIDTASNVEARRDSSDWPDPSSIQEALELSQYQLGYQITRLLESRPNNSCVRKKLPRYLLQSWGVVTRGVPRSRFCEAVEECISQLTQDHVVEAYSTARNDRIRLSS